MMWGAGRGVSGAARRARSAGRRAGRRGPGVARTNASRADERDAARRARGGEQTLNGRIGLARQKLPPAWGERGAGDP